jgi:hypothetical protein
MEETTQVESRERELLRAYVESRSKEEMAKATASAATKETEAAKNKLVEYLNDAGKKSTGSYPDLGSVLITDPVASISVPEEHRAEQFAFLHEIGADAVIKETVHHATFASLIKERLDTNQPVPEFVKIFYIPQVRYSKPKA